MSVHVYGAALASRAAMVSMPLLAAMFVMPRSWTPESMTWRRWLVLVALGLAVPSIALLLVQAVGLA